MAAADFPYDTLVSVDPLILSCWEDKAKQGIVCSLTLTHSKGKVTTIFKLVTPDARQSLPVASLPQAEAEKKQQRRRKKRKSAGKKRLESLLSFQERLVRERGLPPSRLMLQHGVGKEPISQNKQPPQQAKPNLPTRPASSYKDRWFKCDLCEFYSRAKEGVSAHWEKAHNPLSTTCKHCEKSFPSPAVLKVHNDAATVYCFLCDRCMNDECDPEQLLYCIENLHGLKNLQDCYYEDAEDPEWWMIFTADPHGDPDGHFNHLNH